MKNIPKIFAITIALILLIPCFASCSSNSSNQYKSVNKEEERKKAYPIDFIYISRDDAFSFYYDRNTKVIYVVVEGTYDYSIMPLYNADGTLKIYDTED